MSDAEQLHPFIKSFAMEYSSSTQPERVLEHYDEEFKRLYARQLHQTEAKPVDSKPSESATFKKPVDGELREQAARVELGTLPGTGKQYTLGDHDIALDNVMQLLSAHLQAVVAEAKLKQSIEELWAIHAANDKALYQYDDGSRVAVIVRIRQLESELQQLKQEEL